VSLKKSYRTDRKVGEVRTRKKCEEKKLLRTWVSWGKERGVCLLPREVNIACPKGIHPAEKSPSSTGCGRESDQWKRKKDTGNTIRYTSAGR